MAEYLGPSTTSEAVMIETARGRLMSDRFATMGTSHDGDGGEEKLNSPHGKCINPDIYEQYGQDTPESEAW